MAHFLFLTSCTFWACPENLLELCRLPLPFLTSYMFWACSENLLELSRTSYSLYKAQFLSSPSDLMKSTVVDESLSTNATRVLFHRKTTSLFVHRYIWTHLWLKVGMRARFVWTYVSHLCARLGSCHWLMTILVLFCSDISNITRVYVYTF